MKFTKQDIQQIKNKGLRVEQVETQLHLFKTGLPFINIVKAATLNHGIVKFTETEKQQYITLFDEQKDRLSLIKFVPASGSATRLFSFLFEFLEDYDLKKESVNAYINRTKQTQLSLFLVGLKKFPFYNKVKQQLSKKHKNYEKLNENEQIILFVKTLLYDTELDYANLPKGLIPFHQYKDHVATPFEEHLFEAPLYAANKHKTNLHFTVSKTHKNKFEDEFLSIQEIVQKKTHTTYYISYSYQDEASDTIAVNQKNEPIRNANGSLHFRPSGHGALIKNLNALTHDIIFIKNIDNVVVYKYEKEIAANKKLLAGVLLHTQNQAFKYLNLLEKRNLSEAQLIEIAEFLSNKLNVTISSEFEKYALNYQKDYLLEKLNRPIRVCGMVKNEGEPGGGPFWIKDESGLISLQIVESAQINTKDKNQKTCFKKATHFNPVDIVCGIKDYKGNAFNLTKFINHKTAFVTIKTKLDKNIKVLERPGLWNGSMANWNSIFVEVPLITFNPVKTITDLLKTTHQINY